MALGMCAKYRTRTVEPSSFTLSHSQLAHTWRNHRQRSTERHGKIKPPLQIPQRLSYFASDRSRLFTNEFQRSRMKVDRLHASHYVSNPGHRQVNPWWEAVAFDSGIEYEHGTSGAARYDPG